MVAAEYDVSPNNVDEFIRAIRRYGCIRSRDGAVRWGIFRDLEDAQRYLEKFIVSSWAEHLRQNEGMTETDREVEESINKYLRGSPAVRHLISAAQKP